MLEETTYRARPWDTLTYRYSNGHSETGVSGMITIFLSWDEGQQAEYEYFILYSSGTIIKDQTIYTAKDGANLYKSITAIIQEYGIQSN